MVIELCLPNQQAKSLLLQEVFQAADNTEGKGHLWEGAGGGGKVRAGRWNTAVGEMQPHLLHKGWPRFQ